MGVICAVNLNSLDLNLIRVLDAMLAERSVTRAGERIGLSQPAVSAALNRLRHALNDQLFVRNGNDMVPTPRAESLREPVKIALNTISNAFWCAEPFAPEKLERTFCLLSADFFSTLFFPHFAAQILRQAPLARIKLIDSASGDVTRLLSDGVIDIALERPLEVPDWIAHELLFVSPFVVIARRDHPALRRHGIEPGETIPLELFCNISHAIRSIDGSMSGFTDDALAAIGRSRKVALAVPHFHAVALAVARTDLVACLPSQFADATAQTLGLNIYQPPITITVPEISMYWHKRHADSAEHHWLRDQIVRAIDDLGLAKLQ